MNGNRSLVDFHILFEIRSEFTRPRYTGREMRVLFVVATVLALAPQLRGDSAVAVRTIARGTDSRMTAHRELVVRTAGWWQFIWHEHSGSFDPPELDFSRHMVIAVFAGPSPEGTTIEITRVVQSATATTVYYRESTPVTMVSTGRRTSPFHVIAIPATRSTVAFVKITAS